MSVRPRWKKVLADLLGNPVRSLLVILSIAVGLFAVGVIGNIHENTLYSMKKGYSSVRPANIMLKVENFDWELVKGVDRIAEVADALGVREFQVRVLDSDGRWQKLNIRATSDIDLLAMNIPRLIQGAWPPADQQLAIDFHKYHSLGLEVGSDVSVELPSGKIRQMHLVGIVQDQTIGAMGMGGGYFAAPAYGYVTSASLPWLEEPETFNTLYVTLAQGMTDNLSITSVSQKVKDQIERNKREIYSSATNRSDVHPNATYTAAISGILQVLGILVVFLSGFLITNTLAALLNQQIFQIGVMKTIGARRGQIIGVYLVLILVYGVLALGISLPLAYQAAYGLLRYLSNHINFSVVDYHLSTRTTFLQISIAILVPILAGTPPVLHASRVTIQQALSGISILKQRDKSRRTNGLLKRLPRPLLISLRNTFRQRSRLVLTLITLSLGGSMFIATFNVRASLDRYVDQIRHYFLADVNLTFEYPHRIDQVEKEIMQVEGVKHIEGWASGRGEIVFTDHTTAESISILGPPIDSQLVDPSMREGRWIQEGDHYAVVLNEAFRNHFPNLDPGETIRLKINGTERNWIVVGFFQMAGKSSGYLAYTDYDSLSRETRLGGRSSTFRMLATDPYLSPEAQKSLCDRIEAHFRDRGYRVIDAAAGSSLTEATSDGLDVLTTFLLIMSLLTALVGCIGLAGTMSLNVMERTHEIGVMRAIGASDWMIRRLVLAEGLMTGMFSWVIGVLASFLVSRLLRDVIGYAVFDAPSPFAFTFTGVLIWLGAVLVLSVVASLIPAQKAVRLTIREVLAYE